MARRRRNVRRNLINSVEHSDTASGVNKVAEAG